MTTFESRFTGPRPVKVDTWGAVLDAYDVEARRRVLVRRLTEPRRRNPMALAALRAEVDYGRALSSPACPRGQLVRISGSESVLVYTGATGRRLDFVVQELERAGFRLRPGTAIELLRDVITAAVAIQQIRPPAARDRPTWGHGEISASNVVMPVDGRARLINLTFAVAGVPPRDQSAIGARSGPPEMPSDARFGSPAGDVYGLAVLLATLVLGPGTVADVDDLPVRIIERVLRSGVAGDQADFFAVLMAALDPDPTRRFAHVGSFRAALEECDEVDSDAFGLSAIMPALADPRRHPTLHTLASPPHAVVAPIELAGPRDISWSDSLETPPPTASDLIETNPMMRARPPGDFEVSTGAGATTSRWSLPGELDDPPTFGDFGTEESDTSTAGS